MKKIYLIIVIVFNCFANCYSQFNFQRNWGTYFGDERFILADSKIDSNGNLYIVGTIDGSQGTNFPIFTDSNSYRQNYNGGLSDGFIVKFNPAGTIIWGSFIGGDEIDKIGGIDIDNQDNIYIFGSTYSLTNIATTGSFQQNNLGVGNYFISKFSSNGIIVWSTYFGGTGSDFDGDQYSASRSNVCFDGQSHIYISSPIGSNDLSTSGVFQEIKGTSKLQISKFDLNGNRVWTTYYALNVTTGSLKANTLGIYVSSVTNDCPPNNSYNTYYGTSNGFKQYPSNCREIYLTKFNINGQRDWSTYYGGIASELTSNNSISLYNDKIFISGSSPNYSNQEVATANGYQPTCVGASNFIAQFNIDGTRNWGSYNGNANSSGPTNLMPSNINANIDGSYYNYGSTGLIDITTSGAFKTTLSDNFYQDAFVCKFDNNNNKIWGTYYGGNNTEYNIKFHSYIVANGESFYILGATYSDNEIATTNGFQPNKMLFDTINSNLGSVSNIFIAHFDPIPLSNSTFNENSFSIYPNPNNGNFTISLKENATQDVNMILYDVLGKEIQSQKLNNSETIIKTNSLSKGVYFAKIFSEKESITKKIIIE